MTHRFSYDDLGRKTAWEIGKSGDSVFKQTWEYDEAGRLELVNDGLQSIEHKYDGHGRLVGLKDEFANETVFGYDKVGNLTRLERYGAGGGILQKAEYELDDINRYTKVELFGDLNNAVVEYDYGDGLIIMTDAMGGVSRSTFDTAGRLDTVENPAENFALTYDESSLMTSSTRTDALGSVSQTREYSAQGDVKNVSNGPNQSVEFTIGAFGDPTKRTGSDGKVTDYSVNVFGQFERITTAEGVSVAYGFDEAERLKTITDAAGNATTYIYNDSGILTDVVNPNSATTKFSDFDGNVCPQSITMPGGTSVEQTFDRQCQLRTRILNAPGSPPITENYTYDGVGRALSKSKSIPGFPSSEEFEYDLLGFTKKFTYKQNNAFEHDIFQTANPGGFRTSVTYPSAVTLETARDNIGRQLSIVPSAPNSQFDDTEVLSDVTYVGESRFSAREYGSGIVKQGIKYDDDRRIEAVRYENANGDLLAEARYRYQDSGRQTTRQYVHDHARADLFKYDLDNRLTQAHHGARPKLGALETSRAFPGFTDGDFAPGTYSRSFSFDNTNNLTDANTVNPDNLVISPFADFFAGKNSLLATLAIDGVARAPDAVGNTRQALLYPAGPTVNVLGGVTADLSYNALAELTDVIRQDGCTIRYRYNASGLLMRRTVTGSVSNCEQVDEDYVWDGGNLIEIREIGSGGSVVKARFYYGDEGDDLIAGDLADGAGGLQRVYFLSDASRSVMAIANGSGNVIERYRYDAWGVPIIESTDTAVPRVSRIIKEGSDLFIEFSEPVLPPIDTASGPIIVANDPNSNIISLTSNGQPVSGELRFEESKLPFGSVFRFVPAEPLPPTIDINVSAASLVDSWQNPNPEELINVANANVSSGDLFTGALSGSTAPTVIARSEIGSPFMFHGQFFDPDTGLYYMRARWYDPASGLFLTRDPAGVKDSVNLYAAFDNDPVNRRDPTGNWSICHVFSDRDCNEIGQDLKNIGAQASVKKDGYSGAISGMAISTIGGILDLGTGTAQGLEIAGQPRQGPRGYFDFYRGAKMVYDDAQMALVAFNGPSGATTTLRNSARTTISASKAAFELIEPTEFFQRGKAYSISGAQNVRDRALQRLNIKTPEQILRDYYGFSFSEAYAFTKIVHESRINLSFRAGNNAAKLRSRQKNVYDGMYQKPFGVYEKTGLDSTVNYKGSRFVSDVDLWTITNRAGNPLTDNQIRSVSKRVNGEYTSRSGRDNVPIQHMPQLQASRNIGGSVEGFTRFAPPGSRIDNLTVDKLSKIGHPGHTVSIYYGKSGNVIVNRTPGWKTDSKIRRTRIKAAQSNIGGINPGIDTRLHKYWNGWAP